jgi:hypothetical protein
MCNAGRGSGFGLVPFPPPPIHLPRQEPTMYQPHKNLLRFGVPWGALSEKTWIPKLMCNAGRGSGFGLAPFPPPTQFTSPGKSPRCISPIKHLLRFGFPLCALSEQIWITKLDRCAMLGEAEDLRHYIFNLGTYISNIGTHLFNMGTYIFKMGTYIFNRGTSGYGVMYSRVLGFRA